jgi:hypothetical protein
MLSLPSNSARPSSGFSYLGLGIEAVDMRSWAPVSQLGSAGDNPGIQSYRDNLPLGSGFKADARQFWDSKRNT